VALTENPRPAPASTDSGPSSPGGGGPTWPTPPVEPTTPSNSGEGGAPAASADRSENAIGWLEAHREAVGWLLACIITLSVAIWIYVLQLASPIPPGSDPGNWISISYAYIGGHYPGQVSPYGYPPLLFPILGALVLITGSPVTTGHLIIPILITALGLTTYALSRAILRSVILSLALVSLLLLDPYFMTLFFWGALPNLLAFVFTNLSLLGLVWTGTRGSTKGIAFFWIFGAATILSHSLGGLGLVGIAAVVLVLSMFVPGSFRRIAKGGVVGDAPALLMRRLLFSAPGYYFAVAFVALVGGWYIVIHALGVVGPGYFTPGSAVQPATFGQFLRNVLPGLSLGKLVVFYLLVMLVIVVLSLFGGLLFFRPRWVSTPLLVLLGAWVAIPGIAIVGWLLSVSTDYHRFGFLLVIPAGLSIAFLVDRLWVSRSPGLRIVTSNPEPAPPPSPDPELRPFPPTVQVSPRGRVAFLGVLVVVLILLAASAAGPTYVRYVANNSGTSHDQDFLDALNAIDHSGKPGSVLTIKGNLKWTWAITHRSAYAPRPGNAFLFYPVQITDSVLSYYALTSRDAVTNGLVSASLPGTTAKWANGIPDLSAFQGGGLSAVGQVTPQLVTVTLVGAVNGTHYTEGLTGLPTYQPPSGPGAPAFITYVGSGFLFQQSIQVVPGDPVVYVNSSVHSTGPDPIAGVQEVLTSPPGLESNTQLSTAAPGSFEWQPYGLDYQGLLTVGSVLPATSLEGVSDFYPPAGGAAAIFDFAPSGSGPSPWVNGSLEMSTPHASGSAPNLPPIVNTTQVWNQLGVEFILIPDLQSFSLYAGSFLLGEWQYLMDEFGCVTYYSNAEWVVLTVPST
jgi:hypothetical protein